MFVLCAILLTMKEAQRTGKTTQVTVVSPGGMTVTFFCLTEPKAPGSLPDFIPAVDCVRI